MSHDEDCSSINGKAKTGEFGMGRKSGMVHPLDTSGQLEEEHKTRPNFQRSGVEAESRGSSAGTMVVPCGPRTHLTSLQA